MSSISATSARLQTRLEDILARVKRTRAKVDAKTPDGLARSTRHTRARKPTHPSPTNEREIEDGIRSLITEATALLEDLSPHDAVTNPTLPQASLPAPENLVPRAHNSTATERIDESSVISQTVRRHSRAHNSTATEPSDESSVVSRTACTPVVNAHPTSSSGLASRERLSTLRPRSAIKPRLYATTASSLAATKLPPSRIRRSNPSMSMPLPSAQPVTRGPSPLKCELGVPLVTCALTGLGACMADTLEQFAMLAEVKRAGMCRVEVADFASRGFHRAVATFPAPNRKSGHYTFNTCRYLDAGIVQVFNNPPASSLKTLSFRSPNSPFDSRPMADQDVREVFERFCVRSARQPETSECYYIGTSEAVLGSGHRHQDILTSGVHMRRALAPGPGIPGVDSSYLYASCSANMTATAMHIEDCSWLSANIVLCGAPKLWLCVEPESKQRLEAGVENLARKRTHRFPTCSQRVRHESILLAPSELDRMGVRYRVAACRPGQLIFTVPDAYHQVINLGANVAEAINFLCSTTPASPLDYRFCSADRCDHVSASLQSSHVRHKVSLPPPLRGNIGMKRAFPWSLENGGKKARFIDCDWVRENTLLSPDSLPQDIVCKSPLALVVSLFDKSTLGRLCSLIADQRSVGCLVAPQLPSAPQDEIVGYSLAADEAGSSIDLAILRVRVAQCYFAMALKRESDNAAKLSSTFVDNFLTRKGLSADQASRDKFAHQHSEAGKWLSFAKVKGKRHVLGLGLLAILPLQSRSPYCISSSTLVKMSDSDIGSFARLLHHISDADFQLLRLLCEIGAGLVARILHDIRFALGLSDLKGSAHTAFEYRAEWTGRGIFLPPHINESNRQAVLDQLQMEPYLERNCVARDGLEWNLDGWPSEYSAPVDPLLRPNPPKACQDVQAGCRNHVPAPIAMPLIQTRGDRVEVRTTVAYPRHAVVGELIGELFPIGHEDCQAEGNYYEVRRTESLLQGMPTCHIHWRQRGNWVRLVPHSRAPTTFFDQDTSTCRVRIVLRASFDLDCGSLISVDWSTSSAPDT